jgi:hypothetical protein
VIIKPTVGRVVWYFPAEGETYSPADGRSIVSQQRMAFMGDQPMAAQVVYVHGDRCVNLMVTDHLGCTHICPGVQLVQDGDVYVTAGARAEWTPFQQGQARAASQHPALAAACPVDMPGA